MKLRMKNNSVRLRLTQNEVARFAETGQVRETIQFGSEPQQQFVYCLESSSEIAEIQARFKENRLIITVPERQAKDWANTAQIGLKEDQKIGGGNFLRVTIEKDFACLEPRDGEDETDAFPHPLEKQIC